VVDLAALRWAQPGLLDRAADEWQMLSTRLGSQETALRSDVMQPLFGTGDWTGMAADAASASLGSLSRQLSVTQDYAATMTSLLRDAAGGVRDAQSLLRAAENLAAQNRLTIGADGGVSAEPAPPLLGGPGSASLLAQPPPAAGEVADLVARALSVADAVDGQITARFLDLRKFAGASSAAASELRGADRLAGAFDHAMLPPQGTSPAEVNQWWQALGTGQQQRLIREFPSQVGWMDGVPATARDQANRLGLSQEGAQLKTQLASLQGHKPPQYLGEGRFGPDVNPAWQQWQGQVSGIETKLAGITSVEQALSIGGRNGYPPAYLLGFNTTGNGRAIVSFGNPDTASNVVTYVPGLGSKINGAPGDSGRAAALWQQANRFAPNLATASVYWLGYNAPQLGLSQGIHNLDVTSTADAVTGGQALAHFETGLQATHQPGIPGHAVVLGHSYGSLVVGEAAAHDGLHAGDIIFVGSPGVGVNHAAQLGMSSTHVWAGANVHDPVPQLPPSNPLTALGNDNAGHFGNNPATSAFGGQVFNASHDPSRSFSGLDLSAHSAYWDANSDSLKNMARIVDGQYSGVTMQDPPALSPVPDPGPIVGPGVI
jgi:Alpha/beta hydrolase